MVRSLLSKFCIQYTYGKWRVLRNVVRIYCPGLAFHTLGTKGGIEIYTISECALTYSVKFNHDSKVLKI